MATGNPRAFLPLVAAALLSLNTPLHAQMTLSETTSGAGVSNATVLLHNCGGLHFQTLDKKTVFFFDVGHSFTLQRDLEQIDTQWTQPFFGVGTQYTTTNSIVRTAAGVYLTRKDGNTSSNSLTMKLAANLTCASDMPVADFGGGMWFATSDPRSAPVVGDFDGDGYQDDIAYYGLCGTPAVECWSVHIGHKTGFDTHEFGGGMWFYAADVTSAPVVGDFDGDGKIDDIAYRGLCGTPAAECWRAHISDGTTFHTVELGQAGLMWFHNQPPPSWSAPYPNYLYAPVVGDFDNDGKKDDIAYLGYCGNGHQCWRVNMVTNSLITSVADFGDETWPASDLPSSAPVVGDFDHDGYEDDIAYYGRCGNGGALCWRVHLGQKDHFVVTILGTGTWPRGLDATNKPVAGVFGGDKIRDDIVYTGLCSIGYACWRAHYDQHSTSGSIASNGWSLSLGSDIGENSWFQGTAPINIPLVGDFDNDGKIDDIAYYGRCGDGHPCWRIHMGN